MSLFFAPVANVVLGSVRRDQEGIASGANNAIRELGGVFGIAVLGAVFSAHGGYASGPAFVSGMSAAVWVGAAAVAVAAGAALLLPRLRTATATAARPSPRPSWSRSADRMHLAPAHPAPGPGAQPARRRPGVRPVSLGDVGQGLRRAAGLYLQAPGTIRRRRHRSGCSAPSWRYAGSRRTATWQLTVPWISLMAGSVIGASAS